MQVSIYLKYSIKLQNCFNFTDGVTKPAVQFSAHPPKSTTRQLGFYVAKRPFFSRTQSFYALFHFHTVKVVIILISKVENISVNGKMYVLISRYLFKDRICILFFVIVTVIVTVIVPYTMFILLLSTEIEEKHCHYHYDCDYDCDKKIKHNAPPLTSVSHNQVCS